MKTIKKMISHKKGIAPIIIYVLGLLGIFLIYIFFWTWNNMDNFYIKKCEKELGKGTFSFSECPNPTYKNWHSFFEDSKSAENQCLLDKQQFLNGLPKPSRCNQCEIRLFPNSKFNDGMDYQYIFHCGRLFSKLPPTK